MYPIRPRNVYVHERVLDDPRCIARMKRMMTGIEPDKPPVTVDDATLNEISREERWERVTQWRTGQYNRSRDPDLIFNTYAWRDADSQAEFVERYPHLRFARLSGAGFVGYRDGEALLEARNGICQNAYDLHSVWGCLHTCDYCCIGTFLNIHLNLEEMVERLPAILDKHRWCRLWKYDNITDTITFEPEYGASELMIGAFADRATAEPADDQYLMLYTKSANVDHLLKLDHGGRTIISWTISSETVAREIEKNSPSTSERVEAARRCQEAGYHVRARFSPIVPVKGWREESARMIADYLEQVRPDVITMDALGLLGYDRLCACFDLELLDPVYVEACRKIYEADEHPGKPYWPEGKQMFPHDLRLDILRFYVDEIRRYDSEVPISFCDETPEMWAEFSHEELGQGPEDYVCTCGPTSVPGNPLLRTV
ncbi:MAG: spore photoproduct lyase family protein, partial [Armatimonadota bacterium]